MREQLDGLIAPDETRNRAAVDHLFELAWRGQTGARDLLQQCALGEVEEVKPAKASQEAAANRLVALAGLRPDYGLVLLAASIEGYSRLRDGPVLDADLHFWHAERIEKINHSIA